MTHIRLLHRAHRWPLLLLLLSACIGVRAELEEDNQLWLRVTTIGRWPASATEEPSRVRYWLEGQVRFDDDASRHQQHILRPGLGYDLTPRLALWAGYAWIYTDPIRGRSAGEHRPWQQLTWAAAQPLAGFAFSTRSRLEQRLVEDSSDTGWRLRQLFRGQRPLRGPWSVVLQDEVFVNFNDADTGAAGGFDQNRLFAGFAYQFTPTARAEVGYLNQFIGRPERDDRMHHVLSLGIVLTP
jgi:hypothetical protein